MRFDKRVVKWDGQGLFIHYGSFRYRPMIRKSKYVEGEEVTVLYDVHKDTAPVFTNTQDYEVWGRKK
jgi:hypothetical protein